MLLHRVITAVVLLAVLVLALVAHNPVYFLLILALLSAVCVWEWLRLSVHPSIQHLVPGFLAFICFFCGAAVGSFYLFSNNITPRILSNGQPDDIALIWQSMHQEITSFALVVSAFASLLWLVWIPFVLRQAQVSKVAEFGRHSVFAIVSVCAAFLSLMYFYKQPHGAWLLVSFLITIWVADTFAYFGGRLLQGPKLAPTISPKKTQSGGVCGLIGGVVWLYASLFIDGSFAQVIAQHSHWSLLFPLGIVLVAYSVVGDLYESLIKRRANVKDSGKVLPGHGGVWDRIDAILPTAPMAFVLYFLLTL